MSTADETWLPSYEKSKQWCRKQDRPPLKAKTAIFEKFMITAFCCCEGAILVDYLESGHTLNSELYSNLLSNNRHKALNKRHSKLSSIPFLQHDNTRPHTAALFFGKTLEKP